MGTAIVEVPVNLSFGPGFGFVNKKENLTEGLPKIVDDSWSAKKLSKKQEAIVKTRIYDSMKKGSSFSFNGNGSTEYSDTSQFIKVVVETKSGSIKFKFTGDKKFIDKFKTDMDAAK